MKESWIKVAATNRGWAIGLLEVKNRYTGDPIYQVARINPQDKYLVLFQSEDLAEARAAANSEWDAEVKAAS
jgi:hypothetical protein